MLGSICGDVIGSKYESTRIVARPNFSLFTKNTYFTDDTVHTLAIADAIMSGKSYYDRLHYYYRKYPYVGYGSGFKAWIKTKSEEPYNSWGNGSAMRVSPIAWAFDTKKEVMEEAKKSAEVTHNHEEGIRGAQAIALAIFMARSGESKEEIKKAMVEEMGYDLSEDKIPKGFKISCQESIPQALVAFLDSTDYVDSVRKAIHMEGDSDTLACIAGSIAQPYYSIGNYLDSIPEDVILGTFERLPEDLSDIAVKFINEYVCTPFNKPATMSNQAQLTDLFRSIFS